MASDRAAGLNELSASRTHQRGEPYEAGDGQNRCARPFTDSEVEHEPHKDKR